MGGRRIASFSLNARLFQNVKDANLGSLVQKIIFNNELENGYPEQPAYIKATDASEGAATTFHFRQPSSLVVAPLPTFYRTPKEELLQYLVTWWILTNFCNTFLFPLKYRDCY